MTEEIKRYLNDFEEKSYVHKRHRAARIEKIAEDSPEDLIDHIPTIEQYIDVDGEKVTKKPSPKLLAAVGHVAGKYPEEVLPLVPTLERCFEDSIDDAGYTAVPSGYALGMVAKEYPYFARENIPLFVEATNLDGGRAGNNAMAILGDLADEYQDELIEYLPRCVEGLDAEGERMRSNALLVVARVADKHPDVVHQEVETNDVTEMLDSEKEIERTRENACWTLLYLGERVIDTVPELRKASEDDPSERVKEVAEMAADHIENRDKDRSV